MGRFYKQSVKGKLTRRLAYFFLLNVVLLLVVLVGSFLGIYVFQNRVAGRRATLMEIEKLTGEVHSKAGELQHLIQSPINDLRISSFFYNSLESGELSTRQNMEERSWYHFAVEVEDNFEEYEDKLVNNPAIQSSYKYPEKPG